MLDAKAVETGMLLDKIEKLTEAQILIMYLLKIRSGSDGLAPIACSDVSQCSHGSSFEHVELDCPVMAVRRREHDRREKIGKIEFDKTCTCTR